jgi:type I restriction enzyme, S subunit
MKNNWIKTTLGDFLSLQRGHDLTEPERRDGSIPVMGSAGPNGLHDTALAKGPGIVIGRSGASFGQVHLSKCDFWPHNTGLYVTDFKGNDPLFAYYFLKTIDFTRFNSGSAQPSLNRNFIYPIPVRIPPLAEQKRIAGILGALDDKIELNRKMNETLEQMAKALFRSWFVDFDPVHAKAAGRQPAGMDKATADLFPDSLVDSELGKIPKGWIAAPLSHGFEILSGGTPRTSEEGYWNGGIPWYSVKDAPADSDIWVLGTEKTVTQEGVDNSAAQILPARTTIISARGTVGKLALTGLPMAMNQSCFGLRGKNGISDLTAYFIAQDATVRLLQNTHGTVFDTINRQTFEGVKWQFPPGELSVAFEKQADQLLSKIKTNLEESRTLSALRDTLLPRLLCGDTHLKPND